MQALDQISFFLMNRLRNIQIYEFSELRVSVWRLNIVARGPTEFYTNRDKNLPKKNLRMADAKKRKGGSAAKYDVRKRQARDDPRRTKLHVSSSK